MKACFLALCIFNLVSSLLQAQTGERGNDLFKVFANEIRSGDCWAILIIPMALPEDFDGNEMKLHGNRVGQFHEDPNKQVKPFLDLLEQGKHPRITEEDRTGKDAGLVGQYNVYFMMNRRSSTIKNTLALYEYGDGRVEVQLSPGDGYWLDNGLVKWIRQHALELPVGK